MLSVIIPHRGRERHLAICLWAIVRSAWEAPGVSLEVLVVEAGPWPPGVEVVGPIAFRTILDPEHGRVFNKPRLLNLGIERARGDVIAFLDADAIVGKDWAASTQRLLGTYPPTKLCYRVKQVRDHWIDAIEEANWQEREDLIDWFFWRWDEWNTAFEAYGEAHVGFHRGRLPGGKVFGNSQFAIRRDVLGDMRFDERYEGGGFEDIEFNRRLGWLPGYQAEMVTEPASAMIHLYHPRTYVKGDAWADPEMVHANERRYFSLEEYEGCQTFPSMVSNIS